MIHRRRVVLNVKMFWGSIWIWKTKGRRSFSKEEKRRSGKGIEKEQRKRGANEVGATKGM